MKNTIRAILNLRNLHYSLVLVPRGQNLITHYLAKLPVESNDGNSNKHEVITDVCFLSQGHLTGGSNLRSLQALPIQFLAYTRRFIKAHPMPGKDSARDLVVINSETMRFSKLSCFRWVSQF